jgi:hypothetical protein
LRLATLRECTDGIESSEVESCPTEDAIAKRLLETLTGVGPIHAGDVPLRTARYELSLWSDDRQPAPEEDLEGAASVEGHIDITGIAEAVVLAGPGSLTLTLEDGRRLAFELTGTGGAIVGRGWLP